MKKEHMKKFREYAIVSIIMIVFFTIIVTLPGLIPQTAIKKNVEKSLAYMMDEGFYPSVPKNNLQFLDNWADSVLLNIVFCQNRFSIGQAIANPMVKEEKLTVHQSLKKALDDANAGFNYSNYWFGCKLILKIALVFFDLGQIRYILFSVYWISFICAAFIISKRFGNRVAVAYGIPFFVFQTFYNCCSLTAFFDLVSIHIEVIVLCMTIKISCLNNVQKKVYRYMYIFGALCGFLQWIYIPLAIPSVLGIVIIMFEKENSRITRTKIFLKNTIVWILGYVFSLLSKQVFIQVFLSDRLGIQKMNQWANGSFIDRIKAIVPPLKSLIIPEIGIAIILLLIVLVFYSKGSFLFSHNQILESAWLLALSLLYPILWFLILPKATTHGWYCQNFIPVLLSFCICIMSMINEGKECVDD